MEIGKLTNEELDKIIFSKLKLSHQQVLVGSGMGEDCSIIDFGEDLCVISTDPITATTNNMGKLAVHVSCNDVAAKGLQPFAIMVTILAPPHCLLEEIQELMEDIIQTTNELSIQIIGGHTEITDAVNRMVISTTCIGSGPQSKLLLGTEEILAGDMLLMTKVAASEGTSILYHDFKDKISHLLNNKDIEDIKILSNWFSVIEEGVIASKYGVKMMHDVTEGGILGAAWEMAQKSQLGVEIYIEDIPILAATKKITSFFCMDPYKLISSGVMLMIIPKEKCTEIQQKLNDSGIRASIIGKFHKGYSNIINHDGSSTLLLPPKSDELYKAYI